MGGGDFWGVWGWGGIEVLCVAGGGGLGWLGVVGGVEVGRKYGGPGEGVTGVGKLNPCYCILSYR